MWSAFYAHPAIVLFSYIETKRKHSIKSSLGVYVLKRKWEDEKIRWKEGWKHKGLSGMNAGNNETTLTRKENLLYSDQNIFMKLENIFLQEYIHTCMTECTNMLVANKSRKWFKQVMLQHQQNALPMDASSNLSILGHSLILSILLILSWSEIIPFH